MSYFEYFHRLKDLDYLIRAQATGTSKQVAKRLGICRRTVFEYMSILKNHGAQIKYNAYRKTYYYVNSFSLKI